MVKHRVQWRVVVFFGQDVYCPAENFSRRRIDGICNVCRQR